RERVVVRVAVVGVRETIEQRTGADVREGREAQAMRDFVHHHVEEVDLPRRCVAVQAVVPGRTAEAGRVAIDAAVELRLDVDVAGRQVEAGDGVGQGRVVPGIGNGRAREVP